MKRVLNGGAMDAMEPSKVSAPTWGKPQSDFIQAVLSAGEVPMRGDVEKVAAFASSMGLETLILPPMPDVLCRSFASCSKLHFCFWKDEWGLNLPIPDGGDYLGQAMHGDQPAPTAGCLYDLGFQLYLITQTRSDDKRPGVTSVWGKPVEP